MEHIDRKRLYTDRTYRYQYVTSFLEFGAKGIEAIRKIREPLLELVPAIVDAVYDKLFSYDVTKILFMTPLVSDYSGEYPSDLADFDLNHPLMTKRKDHLGRYLRMVISGEIGDSLPLYMELVAKVHNGYQREGNFRKIGPRARDRLHVEYIHINCLSGWLNSFIASAIIDSALPRSQAEAAVAAFTRIFWLQNDYFLRLYVVGDFVDEEGAPSSTPAPAPASTPDAAPRGPTRTKSADAIVAETEKEVLDAALEAEGTAPTSATGSGYGASMLASVGIASLFAGVALSRLIR